VLTRTVSWLPARLSRPQSCRLLQVGSFDAAFSLVLSNSNVDLLAWVCAQLRPDELFGTSPPPLRQGVLLSLVQQLGCDLSRDPSSRAAWIREAVLSMDPSDPLLAPHIQSILSNVYLLLEREVATRDGHVKADLRLCMRVISSLVRE
jgi:enhancer of mRNA-decapping protein 4